MNVAPIAHVMATVITPPVAEEMDALAHVPPEPMAVFEVEGAVQPVGTVTVAYEPVVNPDPDVPLLVNVKTNWFAEEPVATPPGATVIVPVPFPVGAADATPGATNGDAIAPIIKTGRRNRRKRFIVIHLSLGSRRLIESC
jgi:hypothetical protein